MIQFHGVTLSLGVVGIDEHDLSRKPAKQQRISESRANVTDADHGDSGRTGMRAGFSCQ
jgi:hypothetical protein